MIRNFGGVTGLTNQPMGLDVGIGGGSLIKSVQSGVITFDTQTSLTATISAVDLTKSVVMVSYQMQSNGAAVVSNRVARVSFQNSTTLIAQRTGAVNVALRVAWQVIEFADVKSLQTGNISVSVTPTNVTINAINMSKSIVFANFSTDYATDSNSSALSFDYYLSNNTTLTFNQYDSFGTKNVNWFVAEFN